MKIDFILQHIDMNYESADEEKVLLLADEEAEETSL